MVQPNDSGLNLGELISIRYNSGVLRGWKRQVRTKSGRSAAWLARYLGVVEVVGSNPAGPTSENPVIPKGIAGFFRVSVESWKSSQWSGFDPTN